MNCYYHLSVKKIETFYLLELLLYLYKNCIVHSMLNKYIMFDIPSKLFHVIQQKNVCEILNMLCILQNSNVT